MMKIVKEHIYEKFSDVGTDPVKDMGIGKDALDKKLIEETDWAIPEDKIVQTQDIFEVIHDYKGYPILILKNKKHSPQEQRNLPPYRAISIVGVFGTYQNTRNKALKNLTDSIDREIEKERISNEIWLKSQKPSTNYTKIHERFSDESDPIADMGIGYAPYKQALRHHQLENKLDALGIDLLAEIQKLFETNNLATIYYLGTHQYEEFGEVSPSAKWIETEILDGHLIKRVDTEWNGSPCTLRLFKTILGKICDISFRGLDHKDRCDRFIGDLQTAVKIYNPSKNESVKVNEKFLEDSDPVKDMGIGMSLPKLKNKLHNTPFGILNSEYFPDHSSNGRVNHFFILEGFLIRIVDLLVLKYNVQKAFDKVFDDYYNDMEKSQENISMFNKRQKLVVDVLKKHMGFEVKITKKKLNEKFSEDSDPVKDLGIGLEHIKRKYKWLILPHYLDDLTKTDKNKVKKAMNTKVDDLFYLGETNLNKKSAFVKVYLLRIKRLIGKASKIYREEYIEYVEKNKNELTTIITSYDTKIGKIGTFEYTAPEFKEIIQYFGDVDALMTLKPYEIIEHER